MTTSSYAPSAASNAWPMDVAESHARGWSFALRIAFRFVFSFIFLLIFPFPFGSFPGDVIPAFKLYDKAGSGLVSWVATHIFHFPPLKQAFLGLADATAGYVSLFCFVVIAILATIIWTALDRKRTAYRTLHEWLRVYARYMLAFTMLGYGMDKVFALQFVSSQPGLLQMAEPFGNFSRISVLWTFMGFSTAYTVFTGLVEVLGAVLLFFRRTTTLGALILCGAMTNVVMLNFCYGVPVKLFSSSLLLLAIFLAAPEAKRLTNLLVLNRPTAAVDLESPFRRQWMRVPHAVAKALIIAFALYWYAGPFLRPNRVYASAPKSPLYGLYQVDSFTQDGKPIAANDANWRRVIFDQKARMAVIATDDSMHYYPTDYDGAKNTVTISDANKKSVLAYSRPDAEHLDLRGNSDNHAVAIELRKVDISKFRLVSEKFRWSFRY
ncbi:MAG: hypothetical protein WBD87_08460 [Candidatus Acidiferrales bacterium]